MDRQLGLCGYCIVLVRHLSSFAAAVRCEVVIPPLVLEVSC